MSAKGVDPRLAIQSTPHRARVSVHARKSRCSWKAPRRLDACLENHEKHGEMIAPHPDGSIIRDSERPRSIEMLRCQSMSTTVPRAIPFSAFSPEACRSPRPRRARSVDGANWKRKFHGLQFPRDWLTQAENPRIRSRISMSRRWRD